MCQLMGMSANVPTDARFSFTGLVQRGGGTDIHRDGWGIVFYRGKGIQEFKDPDPGAESEVAKLVKLHAIKSKTVISHIRQANVGQVNLENTHPFRREMWGQNWSFAHNGQLKDGRHLSLPLGRYLPIGSTDSEHIFCWMLDQIHQHFPTMPRDRNVLLSFIKALASQLHSLGVSNFLMSDGNMLLAHCSNHLHWITRRAPFGEARLKDVAMTVDFAAETTPKDVVTVIATEPLTVDEQWTAMRPGEMIVFEQGEVSAHFDC
jgi:predicted glutamine amidotransferase